MLGGGHARIWSAICAKYLRADGNWMAAMPQIFPLLKGEILKPFEKSVLLATADYALVKDFKRFAADLRSFAAEHPVEGVSHLTAWADHLDSCEAEMIGFHSTSVAENLWEDYDLSGDKHFFVFEDLK